MDSLYTLIIIILIGMFVYWHQQKQREINILKSKHRKKMKHKKKLEKRTQVYKKNISEPIKSEKKVKFAENIRNRMAENDEISIDSLESNDYTSLGVDLKNNDSEDDFLDD